MTPLVCAMEMVEYLKNVFKEHIQEEGAKSKDILIKDGFLPRVTTEDEKRRMTPAIIVTPVLITTPKPTLDEDSTVKLEINVLTYSKDKMEGHRELFHILEKIRMAIFKKPILAKKFSLSSEHDVKATIPYDQPYPQWWALIEVYYTIGRVIEEGLFKEKGDFEWKYNSKLNI